MSFKKGFNRLFVNLLSNWKDMAVVIENIRQDLNVLFLCAKEFSLDQ